MMPTREGRYRARMATTAADLDAARALRGRCFLGGAALDGDALDARCRHLLVEDAASGRLVACCRMMLLRDGAGISASYSAQSYDLTRLSGFSAPMAELGRFCIAPEAGDPDILRLAWAAIAHEVDAAGVELIFGCTSFAGTEPAAHADAFAMLGARHLAPRRWWPRVKAPQVFRFARALRRCPPDPQRARAAMPPLLRSYLAMGGWVSDHAVVDRHLGTLHVFTGVELRAIPAARLRFLRGAG